MTFRAWLRSFVLVGLLSGTLVVAREAIAQDTPNALTEERLRAAYADARAAVEAELGVGFDPPIELKLVDAATVAQRVAEENLPAMRLRHTDEDRARAEADRAGTAFGEFAYAKYAWSTREFLVVRENWERGARALEKPELVGDSAVRAVLVHELVHAIDDTRHDLGACVRNATTIDAALAISAVIEGHAQFVARRICDARGWNDGFAAFTDSIGSLAPSTAHSGEAMRMLLRAQGLAMASAYHDGERFVAAIDAAGGQTARERAFREPPLDVETVLHPTWWLDPKARPAVLYDPEPALDRFVARFPTDEWTNQRISLSSAQVASSLALLPPAEVEAIASSVRNVRAVSLQPARDPNSRLAIGLVLEFADARAAEAWIDAAERLGRVKDEAMKKGVVRIVASKYERIARADSLGCFQGKEMRNGFTKFAVDTFDVARGRIVVETLFSGEPPPNEEHVALAIELLELVKVKP